MPKAPKRHRLSRTDPDLNRRPTQVTASRYDAARINELARKSRGTQALVLERLLNDFGETYLEKYGEQLELFFEPIDERLRHAIESKENTNARDTTD